MNKMCYYVLLSFIKVENSGKHLHSNRSIHSLEDRAPGLGYVVKNHGEYISPRKHRVVGPLPNGHENG